MDTEDFQNTEVVSEEPNQLKEKIKMVGVVCMIGYNSLKVSDYQLFENFHLFNSFYKNFYSQLLSQEDATGIAVEVKAGQWNNISIPFSRS